MINDHLINRLLQENPNLEVKVFTPSGAILPIDRIGQARMDNGTLVLTIEAGQEAKCKTAPHDH